MVFDENLRLRDPTPQEIVELAGMPDLIRTQTLVAAFKRWRAEQDGD